MTLPRGPRAAWAALGVAMLGSAALILWVTQGQTFAVDEVFYYGRVAEKQGALVHYAPFSPEYLLAPFNDHLALGGRFLYETVFATIGAEYDVFVLLNVAALLAVVALTFELARRRVGYLAALGPCVVLLFLGFAREQLLWPLDLNTAGSLAAGLGAVLAIQREDRRGDLLACLLLCLSVALIELGLSFALGIAAWLLLQRGREAWRGGWIVVVPVALYALWWLWARQFEQNTGAASNLDLIPQTLLDGAAAVMGSLTGSNPVLPGSYGNEVTWFGKGLAMVAAVALAARLWLGSLPRTIWIWLVVLGSYWVLLGLAARPPEGSRYILVGAVLVVLIGADALRGLMSRRLAIGLLALAAVALPANVVQLVKNHEEDTLHRDTPVLRTEFAMLELAREHVDPGFMVTADPRVADAGGALFLGIPAGAYLDAAAHNGSIAFSLDEVREQDERIRLLADAALSGALGIELEAASPPAGFAACRVVGANGLATFPAPPGELLMRAGEPGETALWLRRFADSPRAIGIGYLRRDEWVKLTIPPDGAREPWYATLDGRATVCPGR